MSTAVRAKARSGQKKQVESETTSGGSGAVRPPRVVFDGIVRGLYEGRYVAGQRLVEADIVQTFGVSRGSVREALNRLAAEGTVVLEPHRGARIRLLSRKDAQDMLTLLEMLHGLAARLAADGIERPGARRNFQRTFDALMSYRSRAGGFELVRARNSFYRALIEMGGNQELGRVLSGVHVHLLRVQFRLHHTEVESVRFADYQSIGEAVLAGNPKQAELAAQRHVRRMAVALADLPDHVFPPIG